jgi:hypothetical protein
MHTCFSSLELIHSQKRICVQAKLNRRIWWEKIDEQYICTFLWSNMIGVLQSYVSSGHWQSSDFATKWTHFPGPVYHCKKSQVRRMRFRSVILTADMYLIRSELSIIINLQLSRKICRWGKCFKFESTQDTKIFEGSKHILNTYRK